MNNTHSLPLPNHRQLEWYGRELSAFLHFGLNTFCNREWGDGTDDPAMFNPTDLDCRQWIRTLKEAGFKIAILTAKHHDGFCLWPSKYTDYSVKSSPYKNGKGDIVREFTDACREYGMKAGIYLSPWDRHEPTWGTDAYNDYYAAQLTELMTEYGEIYECWWDGAGSDKATYDWARWGNIVRQNQPNAVIFGSLGATPYVDVRWVGNEVGEAGDPCWATVDSIALEKEIAKDLNAGNPNGGHFYPAEADVSIRPGWFWHEDQNDEVRSTYNLFNLWLHSVGRNAGLLLNIPPDTRGLLHENDVAALREFGAFLKDAFRNGLTAQRTEAAPAPNTLELTCALKPEAECNLLLLGEDLTRGQQIRQATVWAEIDGAWKTLWEGSCIGYKRAIKLDPIKPTRIRIRAVGATETPILPLAELYAVSYPQKPTNPSGYMGRNYLDSTRAIVEKKDNEIYIQLGGIRPFNTLKLEGRGIRSYTVSVFNGSTFEPYGKGEGGEVESYFYFGRTVDWSYRLKITIDPTPEFNMQSCHPKLYRFEV